jgi:hypothetical protein
MNGIRTSEDSFSQFVDLSLGFFAVDQMSKRNNSQFFNHCPQHDYGDRLYNAMTMLLLYKQYNDTMREIILNKRNSEMTQT